MNSDIFKVDNGFSNLDRLFWSRARPSKGANDGCRIKLCLCLCNSLRTTISAPSIASDYRFRSRVSSSFSCDKVRGDGIGRGGIPISPSSFYTFLIAKVWGILPENVAVRITLVGLTRTVTLIFWALRRLAANDKLQPVRVTCLLDFPR